jgi:N-acetylmuramoyl-L-alanine amidase
MRARLILAAATTAMLIAPASASAMFAHVVAPGETLTSIAAADGLTVNQLASANGISADAWVVSGSIILIPPQSGPVAASAAGTTMSSADTTTSSGAGDGDNDGDDPGAGSTAVSTTQSSGSYVVQPGDTLSAIAARAGMSVAGLAAANGLDPNATLLSGSVLRFSGSGTSAPASSTQFVSATTSTQGSYVVQPGDTLSGIAARAGLSVASLAAANGVDPNAPLLSGSVLRVSGSSGVPSAASQPVGTAAEGNSTAPPYPTPERVSSSEIGQIASANGVSPSLAAAIAWQESGFNNDLVSSADARGVMQILPGTWAWIQNTLAQGGPPLAPASAADNVRGGVLMLRSLLNSTGGDPALAAAGYYQGLPSVQRNGMYSSTQQYVNDVLALRSQFGGG